MEDYAYVLDVLPEGRPDSKRRFRREPLVYGLGIEEFKIFDMQPVAGAAINIGDKCYIGKETEDRTQIDHVRARVNYSDLTHTAQSELSFVLDEIVKDNEEKFIQFYNHAGPISRRYHSLELIPGLGKKTMNLIVSNRPYKTFKEKGIEECRRTPELSNNLAIQKLWSNFNPKLIKKRCTFRKEL